MSGNLSIVVVVVGDRDVYVRMCVCYVIQCVKIQNITIHTQAGVILVLTVIHHVQRTNSALPSAQVCYIFEHINVFYLLSFKRDAFICMLKN